jgi:hypothetical protein
MAEIKDVYSLEFNGSQFQTEINSAIQSIDELNSAMEQGVDVADELESAQANLVGVLNTEAKGVEQLNQKREALVNTQKKVNAESKAGVAVNNQLNTTNKQLAVSTGQASVQQGNLGRNLLQGARNLNTMRRSTMMLGNAFKILGLSNPFTAIFAILPLVVEYLFTVTETQNKFNEAAQSAIASYAKEKVALDDLFGSLNNVNIQGEERSAVIDQINKQYGDYLPNLLTETSTAEELAIAYDLVNQALVRKAVTQAKTNALESATTDLFTKRLDVQKRLAKVEKDLLFISSTEQLNRLNKDKENILKEITKIEDDYKTEIAKIDKVAKDLEQNLFIPKSNLTPEQLEAKRLEADRRRRQNLQQNDIKKEQKQTIKQTESFYVKLQKLANDQFKKAIKNIKDEEKERIKSIENMVKITEDALNYEISLTDEGSEERIKAETNYTDVLTSLYKQYAKELGMSETEINQFIADRLKNSIKLYEDYYNKQSNIEINNRERDLNNELNYLEQERNQLLKAATGNAEEQEKINKYYDKLRLDLENEANKEILNSRINLLNQLRNLAVTSGDESLISDIDKQISELNLKITELGKTSTETIEEIKGLTDEQKKLIEQTASLITGVSDNVFNVLNAQVQAYISGLDKAIDKSKSALDEIRSNSEDYNARQLEIEKERLENLENERAKAVEREKILGQVQVAINAAIAISKAAAEGGGVASAFTIAATLASLVAGLAQARVAAGNAFFHGVEYLERGNNKAGRDTIPAMLNEGERVITTDTNNKYWDVLSAVHNNRIPADVLNTFSKAYQQGGIKNALGVFGDNVSLSNELGQKSIFVNVAQSYGGLENRLERIENVLTELPKYMPKTTVSANANGIFRIVEQRQARKNFSRNWSK